MDKKKRGGRKNPAREESLDQLLQMADTTALRQMVEQLTSTKPDARRECLEFLQKHVALPPEMKAKAETEAIFELWSEAELDLAEPDEYGGGDYDTQDHVSALLYELSEKLKKSLIPREGRRALLDEVLPYIKSGNAGMDDALYEVAYAACRDNEDLRDLAERLEGLGKDWPLDNARRIYRKIGDREKYLALRSHRMEYGLDYHDLATFHWEQGERERALAIAREGLQKAKGRMDELRGFLADRAKESGDRQGYLELHFAQATEALTLASYKAFQNLCKVAEWAGYEPKMLAAVERARPQERLKVHMHREEYDQAINILSKMRYPDDRFGGDDLLKIAARLEERYPDQILAFYMSGLGKLNQSMQRETYAQKAKIAQKVRYMWLDVIKAPEKWEAFARQVKTANLKRPAFQEEFAKLLPGWNAM